MSTVLDELTTRLGPVLAKRIYAAIAREAMLHLRHHCQAIVDDPGSTNSERNRANAILTTTAAIVARDDLNGWWTDVATGITSTSV